MSSGGDSSGGGVDFDGGYIAVRWKKSGFNADFDEADDAMPAHGAEAFIVHEQHAHIAIRCDRLCKDAAVHIGMTARFPHQGAAQMVVMFASILAFFEDGLTGEVRKAARNDAKG